MIDKIDISQKDQNLINIKRRLKDFYIKDYNLTDYDKIIVNNYDLYSIVGEDDWGFNEGDQNSRCIKLSEFGIKLLRHVNNTPDDSEKHSRIIMHIVNRVTDLIHDINIWGENENALEASTTLLSMHISIYPNESRYSSTHKIITTSIPEIPSIKSHKYSNFYAHFDENKYKKLLKLSTPRLLTNYINNPNAYLHDVNSGGLSVFNSVINNVYCDHEMLDGIRQDSSAFTFHSTRNVLHVDYSYYLKDVVAQIKYPDFYASVYSELKIPGNYYDVVRKIVQILMHPNIDAVLHGLISSEGKVKLNFNWLDIKGKLGCYIIPSIGLGIFKTENLMFPLRIQMSDIPTSCLKICKYSEKLKCNPFATSIMNIRQIHVTKSNLYDFENCNNVKMEAGIIKKEENDMYMLLDESTYEYSDCNNDYSKSNYIGQLTVIDQVMFWKRICHIHSAGDIN
ncbi:putative envelope protein ODV-E66-11 [Microplitis demolitor]|nr:putative envelope protein ODV-E66-11 [Microplitis demolitor]